MSFTNPAPGGTEGRTDQGVDFSNIRGNIVAVAPGIITTVYQNLSGFGRTVIERIAGGQSIYYAEETGGGTPSVSPGQSVQAGSPIAPGLGSGGIEVGFWNPKAGRAVGASQGYTEGVATPAGAAFRNLIGATRTPTPSGGNLSYAGLQSLWIQNGGDPTAAPMAAAIAMAESRGQQNATDHNSNGTIDRGYWQINSSHGQQSTYDPNGNAKAAIAISNNGTDWSPWTTFKTGAYKQFLGGSSLNTGTGNASGVPSGSGYGGTRPGGGTGGPAPGPGISADYAALRDVRTTQTQDVSFGGSLLQGFLGAFDPAWQAFKGAENLGAGISDVGTLIGDTVKFIENLPWYILRSVELIVGLLLMYWGMRRVSGPVDSASSGIAHITRDVVSATPLGRELRMAEGRRMGTREGQREHARIQARGQSIARERRREGG